MVRIRSIEYAATCEFGKYSTVANQYECNNWRDCSYYGVDSMEIQGTVLIIMFVKKNYVHLDNMERLPRLVALIFQ